MAIATTAAEAVRCSYSYLPRSAGFRAEFMTTAALGARTSPPAPIIPRPALDRPLDIRQATTALPALSRPTSD